MRRAVTQVESRHAQGIAVLERQPLDRAEDQSGSRSPDAERRARRRPRSPLVGQQPVPETILTGCASSHAHIVANGTDAHRKAASQAFVHRLVVIEPGVIQPTYLIPGGIPTDPAENPGQAASTSASRSVTKMVGAAGLEPTTSAV